MQVYQAILKRRSIRSFKQKNVKTNDLKQMVNAARLAPSAANLQYIEYLIVTKKQLRSELFKQLKWAATIAPKGTPKPGCEPVAYIIILANTKKAKKMWPHDVGAAAENIMLTAQSKAIASCWLGAIDRAEIRKIFSIPGYLKIDTVIALGYPKMRSTLAPFKGSVRYWLDKKGILRVPKRPLKEIMHSGSF